MGSNRQGRPTAAEKRRMQGERRELIRRLERDARVIANWFGLQYRVLEAERANVKSRYGVCYSDGSIRIRIHHVKTRRPLKYSSLVNTLCHELAHLRHFNHGPRFKAFYLQLLEFARREGIYRPGPARAPGAAQPVLPARLQPPRRSPTPRPPTRPPAGPPPGPPAGPRQLTLFG